jgi:hypothetical protein
MSAIRGWGAFFRSIDVKTVRSELPNPSILNLHKKGWTARGIQDHLVATLGEESIAHRTATWYLREARINPSGAIPVSDIISLQSSSSDEAILRALEELPFYFLQFDGSRAPRISQPLRSTGGCLGHLGLERVHFGDTAHPTNQCLP